MCNLEEMKRCFVKEPSIIWYDHQISSRENQENIKMVTNICNTIETFNDLQLAVSFLQIDSTACQVITSGTNGEDFVKEISQLDCVAYIRVFCMNIEHRKKWTNNYNKVMSINNNLKSLLASVTSKEFANFKNWEKSKRDFISLAKAIYGDNKHIQEFEKNYNKFNSREIFEWYSKECFLYKLTNNCLRIATADSILYCRLILRDLELAIKEKY